MKTAEILAHPIIVEGRPEPAWLELDFKAKLAAYASLTKPRIGFMVLVTVAIGYLLGSPGAVAPGRLFWTLVGTGLVAGGRAPGT